MNLFYFLFISKKIIFVSTPLQLLNVLELESRHLKEKIIDYKFVFVTNSSKIDLIKIREIKKFFNLKNYYICNANFFLTKLFFIILLKIRDIIKYKISFLIIGNYANKFFIRFVYISEKVFIVDDGTNFFDKKNNRLIKKKKVYFFTFLNHEIVKKYNFKNILKNNFLLVKSKLTRTNKGLYKKNKEILILGSPYVEGEIISLKQYMEFLSFLKNKYINNKIYYFPHPKENLRNLNKYENNFIIIKSHLPIELFLVARQYRFLKIIAFNSTALITLRYIFGMKLNILNYNFINTSAKSIIFSNLYILKIKKIISYLKKYCSINTINYHLE
jgi:hypothetical protein